MMRGHWPAQGGLEGELMVYASASDAEEAPKRPLTQAAELSHGV
jgi:hypothetical protein